MQFSRTRSRQSSSATTSQLAYCSSFTKNIQHILKSSSAQTYNNDTPTPSPSQSLAVTPLVPGPYVPPPALRHLIPRHLSLHSDDEPDHILAITFAILDRAGNRAMSVKELGEAAYVQGYLRTSPSAAGQAIGTHIRNHMARHADDTSNALLSSYRLVGGQEDIRLGSALYCSTPGTCRKGTTVWYLSTAAGKPCPFQTMANVAAALTDPTASSAAPLTATANLTSLKRKIPPDDSAEFQRPNKIRITLRLPPRTPIPPRPRPIIPPLRLNGLVDSSEEPSSDETDSSEPSEEEDDDDDDENMLDDFNSLLADDNPIAIPCAHRSGPAASFCQSQPFFDTCEPPPDSEDEDDDFHNSMLRPDINEDEDALLLNLKSEEFITEFDDIKEEDLAAIVLHELTASPEPLAMAAAAGSAMGVAGAAGVPSAAEVPMTARPELEWSALKLEEGVFSPMDILGAASGVGAADSPASLDLDDLDLTSVSVSSPAPFPPYDATTGHQHHRRRDSSILSVPPPTPWIKTEDESFMFQRHSPEGHGHVDALLSSVMQHDRNDDSGEFVTSPLMSAIPISSGISVRPWENNDWTSASALVPGPESVSTDDVDFFADDMDIPYDNDSRIKASTSAPVLPQPAAAATARRATGGKPLRLSIGGPATFHGMTSSSSSARAGHARRHSHAAGTGITSASNRRLSIISTAFSDWTSGTPEDPDAPLVTPSHTGWRTYQWPLVAGASGSSSTLAHERIDEKEGVEEEGVDEGLAAGAEEEKKKALVVQTPEPSTDEELNRVLVAPSFNQVLSKSLPPNHRISTLLLLGIPVFQCRLDSPPMELIRRIDTDYVNISSIIIYAKYLAQAAPTSRSRSSTNPSNLRPTLPPPPSVDELPPNHVFISSGARVINGGWVSLSTARALVKNYHDLPPFIRRVFLSDSLAEKFPSPIGYVRSMLVSRREKVEGNRLPAFGKPFAKPSSLSAHELLVHGGVTGSNGVLATTSTMPQQHQQKVTTVVKGSVSARGVPLALNTGGTGNSSLTEFPPNSFPLSPVAALSNANALRAKAAQHQAANSMQSMMALTNPLSSFNGWFGKAPITMEREAPLQPEEEEMLNAILKTPPKAKVDPRKPKTLGQVTSHDLRDAEEDEDEDMSVDEKEEEEAVREVVDIGSDEDDDEEDDTVKLPANTKKTKQVIAPRRSLRRMRSISSISSELTVSESESSAPPPSLDSRPALKGKSANKHSSPPAAPALTTGNGRTRRRGDAVTSVPLPARSEPESAKKVKIIEVEEPSADVGKPRRSIRTAKSEAAASVPAPAPAPTPIPAPRASKASQADAPSAKAAPPPVATTSTSKPRRSAGGEKEKEVVDKDGPVLTRAGAAAAAQKNTKRTLRSRA